MRGPELERYEILGELGQGGMSVVYRARDKQLSRIVAVKVLHEFLARQADARKRFHREAVAVAKLHHPGILEIFDYSGPDAKETFIVTELIDGVTLRDFVEKRGRPVYPELAALVVGELIRALRHAHEQSVIHRDLKPENVMITKDGVLKLMDFGLAQLMDGGTKLTATGTLLGSPAHMAPEVIDGNASDARADLFSMGTILFWLATGKLPFEAQNPSALFKKILDGKYDDPQMVEPKIGNGLARIIKRALEPDPEQRYQDVTEISDDLDAELLSVGLSANEANAKKYLVDPETFTREFGPKLIACLTEAGKQALAEKNVGRAMDRFNRVLAIDPDHPEVKTIVARVGRRKQLARRARQFASLTLIGATAAGAAFGAVQLWPLLAPREEIIEEAPRRLAEERPPAETLVSINTSTPAEDTLAERTVTRIPSVVRKEKRRLDPRFASASLQVPASGKNDAGVTADAAGAEPATVSARVSLRIGSGFASIEINGRHRGEGVLRDSYTLGVGEHSLIARGSKGQRVEKKLEVDNSGVVYVLDEVAGRSQLKGDLLIDLEQ